MTAKIYHSKSFEDLIVEHKGLITKLSKQHLKRFPPDLYSLEDLKQIATLALWHATKKYKGDLGAKFGTFAFACISNALTTEYNALSCQKRGGGEADFQLDQSVEDHYATESPDYRLADFMNTLGAQDCDILTMRLHGYTAKEIAEKLDKNYRYIQKKILNFKKELREYLEV